MTTIASDKPLLDRDKLLDLVHWICAHCDSRELGRVKLHKILYFAEMFAYLDRGSSITGQEFIKQKFGPTSRHLAWSLDKLSKLGRIEIKKRNYFGYEKFDFVSNANPATNRLSEYELTIVQDIIEFVTQKTSREISEISHHEPWELVKIGESIPYESAFLMLPVEFTQGDLEWAIEESHRVAGKNARDEILRVR